MRAAPIAVFTTLLLASPAFAQTAAADSTGKGAVLCSWMIYTGIQAQRDACDWEPVPADAAIDQAVTDIEAFIVENSTQPVTLEQLAAHKKSQAGPTVESCEFDPEDRTSWPAMAWAARKVDPAEINRDTADLLSVPREPVMNPCL